VTIAAIAVAVATSAAGCSFLFVDAPPRDHASRRYFDCTSSYLAPGVDTTLGGLLSLGVIGSMSDSSTDNQAIVEGTIVAGAALASATYGFLRASHCRDAKQALAERLLEPPPALPAPGPFPTSPAPAAPPPVFHDPWLSQGPPPGEWEGGPPRSAAPAAAAGDAGTPAR
jgi:hypothetical protein